MRRIVPLARRSELGRISGGRVAYDHEPMSAQLPRRQFVRAAGAAVGALCIEIYARPARAAASAAAPRLLAGWVRIETDGTTTLLMNATEMGQGSTSALAQILAEELE